MGIWNYGGIIGDALGTPVQFFSREDLKRKPITKMEGYGTYDMPPGTWSDDGSMTVATLDSLIRKKGVDYNDIMSCFVSWDYEEKYTSAGEAFDQGNTCSEVIYNYRNNRDYKTCGKTGEYANGNGALMRIMRKVSILYILNTQMSGCIIKEWKILQNLQQLLRKIS